MTLTHSCLTLEEFLALPVDDAACELIDGQAIPKMSPKFFHSRLQKTLLFIIEEWSEGKGRIEPEWGIILKRNGKDWVPVADLTYVSFERLPAEWMEDEACPVPPELVIELIFPGQTFGEMTEKATDYLKAGVKRVWVVDTKARTITIFYPDTTPQTFRKEMRIEDEILPNLILTPQDVFNHSGIS